MNFSEDLSQNLNPVPIERIIINEGALSEIVETVALNKDENITQQNLITKSNRYNQ